VPAPDDRDHASPDPGAAASGSAPEEPADLLRLEDQLCVPLYVASRLVVQAYRPHLEKLGLTYSQYAVLLVLWAHDGSSVKEIGERLALDSGTLTPVLKRLVAAELVMQVRSRGDERSVRTYLTPRGRALRQQAADMPRALLCDLGLGLDEVAVLRAQVKGLVSLLESHLGASGSSDPQAK
jgi:DNA-binding MarR family transcriptional regulator